MIPVLKLVDRMLATGRHLLNVGRTREALDILHRLAGFRELPPGVAEETQVTLATIQLKRRKFRQARRHLRAALLYRPDSARYHHLMASALDADDRADPELALKYYRKALKLDRKQPECLSEFGLLAICLGHTGEGLKALRRAVELAPGDPAITRKLLEGMCQADQPEEARRELRAALFRNARDRRFQKLWSDFQFRLLHERQMAARRKQSREGKRRPVLLRFERPQGNAAQAGTDAATIRIDPAHPPTPPHLPRPSRSRDQRHVQ